MSSEGNAIGRATTIAGGTDVSESSVIENRGVLIIANIADVIIGRC